MADADAQQQQPAAAAAAAPATPEKRSPHRAGGSGSPSTHALIKELDQQYRASRKDWKHPSPAFSSRGDRFAKTKTLVNATYDPAAPSRPASKKGTWSANQQPQRPPVKPLTCNADYDPKSPAGPRSTKGDAAFTSSSPRYPEAKLLAGQQAVGLGHSDPVAAHSLAGTSPMRSRSPRFTDAPVWTTAQYAQNYGTVEQASQVGKGKGTSWAKSKEAQRPSPRKLVDKMYDAPSPTDKRNPAKSCFAGTDDRFPDEKPRAPPVGQYTSPLISVGMLID